MRNILTKRYYVSFYNNSQVDESIWLCDIMQVKDFITEQEAQSFAGSILENKAINQAEGREVEVELFDTGDYGTCNLVKHGTKYLDNRDRSCGRLYWTMAGNANLTKEDILGLLDFLGCDIGSHTARGAGIVYFNSVEIKIYGNKALATQRFGYDI